MNQDGIENLAKELSKGNDEGENFKNVFLFKKKSIRINNINQ